jgi:ABC-type multidrug transport system fused ATPase/permease subunit
MPVERRDARPLSLQPRALSIEGVSFAYPDGRPVLRSATARVEPGEMVAFIGASGAGKSTLLSLLLRFYDPDGGRLTLDGHDFRDVRLEDLRRHVAYVSQDAAVLPLSVADNIAYGKPGASREEIAAAAAMADADEFILDLPHGYDTILAEGGANLSGGQRQRVAVARALLSEAPFLVLDEPTSALDPVHEASFGKMLQAVKRRRTVIMVTHRLESTVDCDRILVLEGGRIREQPPRPSAAAGSRARASAAVTGNRVL